MVRFVRTAIIGPGKLEEVAAFSKDIVAHIKSVTGITHNFFTQTGGPLGRICWQADFEDLGAYQKYMGQLMADPTYRKKVNDSGANGLFVGQARDSLWIQV